MSRLFVRWTVILVAVYLIVCYLTTVIFRTDIWRQLYYLMFELCVCLCLTAQGAYHCKYIRWTAYTIFIEDCVATSDTFLDYILHDWLWAKWKHSFWNRLSNRQEAASEACVGNDCLSWFFV